MSAMKGVQQRQRRVQSESSLGSIIHNEERRPKKSKAHRRREKKKLVGDALLASATLLSGVAAFLAHRPYNLLSVVTFFPPFLISEVRACQHFVSDASLFVHQFLSLSVYFR
jgi:hypothetical protein